MGGGNREEQSIESTLGFLRAIGCPNIRRAEGTEEWERSKGTFKYTPDLMAGPFLGNGHRDDFYIDINAPTGDQYFEPRAGRPAAADVVGSAMSGERPNFTLGDLGEEFDTFYAALSAKLKKYAGVRASPLVGLVIYFNCDDSDPTMKPGPLIAHVDLLRAVDRAIGMEAHLGTAKAQSVFASLLGPEPRLEFLVLPMHLAVTFILWSVDKRRGAKRILFVNQSVVFADNSPDRDHPVVSWLRNFFNEMQAKLEAKKRAIAAGGAASACEVPAPPTLTNREARAKLRRGKHRLHRR